MNIRSYRTLLILITIIISSCGSNDLTAPEQAKEIMPLAIGNRWIWKVQYVDSMGVLVSTRYDTTLITGDTVINDEIWYQPDYNSTGGFINRNDGNWIRYYQKEIHVAKYPTIIGDILGSSTLIRSVYVTSPLYDRPDLDTMITAVEVVDNDLELDVPAGKFRGIKYLKTYSLLDGTRLTEKDSWYVGRDYYCYVPGIGEVQRSGAYKPDSVSIPVNWKRELISYELH